MPLLLAVAPCIASQDRFTLPTFAPLPLLAAELDAGVRPFALVSLCPLSFPAVVAILTTNLLVLVERRLGTTCVRTMPCGIDEALFPRLSSQEGREIAPVVATEGARELATSTPKLRGFSCGRKSDHLSAIRCVADKGPLFFLTWKRSSCCGNHAGIRVSSSHCPS